MTHLESIVAGGDKKKKTKDARCVSGPYGEKNKKKTKKKHIIPRSDVT